MEELLLRHVSEKKQMDEENAQLLKTAKKSTRAQIEAQVIQRQFDLKAKHRDEIDQLEEELGVVVEDLGKLTVQLTAAAANETASSVSTTGTSASSSVADKKAKAQRKKDKKQQQQQQRETAQEQLAQEVAAQGPSARVLELEQVNKQLQPLGFKVKEVLSDGNCLYRAIAHQISANANESDFQRIRVIAASHIRTNADSYAPFIGVEVEDPQFEEYCRAVASDVSAEWGGQLEVRALAEALKRPIHVYEANRPVMIMGEEEVGEPIFITFHRHYYVLGEHYNSVESI